MAPGENLVLLFTYGISLTIWRRQGLIDRELSYYRQLQAAGCGDITLLTYDPADAAPAPDVAPFAVAARPWGIAALAYSLLAPVLRRRVFRRAAIVKSNQSRGAWTGIVAKILHPHLFFVVRCGWVRTRETMRTDERRSAVGIRWAEAVERLTFRTADAIFVVTGSDKRYVETTYGIQADKIQVMPNVVDASLFAPPATATAPHERPRLVYVGRLVEYKNIQAVIRAVAALDRPIDLVVIGDGPYRPVLERLAAELRVAVQFRSFMPNSALPAELRAADMFILPEQYGCGMPKVLLEAMACGTLTIASGVWPHGEVIQDGVNGLVCGVDPDSIRVCLERVLGMPAVTRAAIVSRARAEVIDRYSMAALARREMAFYRARVLQA